MFWHQYEVLAVAGTGAGGFSGDGGPATSAQFNYLFGLSIDSASNLYALDFSNNRIRKISTVSWLQVSNINGATGATGAQGPAGANGAAGPAGKRRTALYARGGK